MKEIWKDIEGYEGLYQVSNFGRIKSLEHNSSMTNIFGKGGKSLVKHNEKIINGYIQNTGYLTVTLTGKKYSVHRLVAKAFVQNPNNYPVINHIDGNKLNNKVDNLEWCTHKHNTREAIRLGLSNPKYNSYKNRIRAKKTNQYDLEGNYIKTYDACSDAERELKSKGIKISARNIRNVCNGIRKTAGGFIWRYVDD